MLFRSFNLLTSIQPLAELKTLLALSLDRNFLDDLSPLRLLTNLRFLSLDQTGLGAAVAKPGLWGQYFQYATGADIANFPDIRFLNPDFSRVDRTVNFAETFDPSFYGAAGFGEHFLVRWTGRLLLNQDLTVTFSTESDDGSWLYIDGRPVVANPGLHKIGRAHV